MDPRGSLRWRPSLISLLIVILFSLNAAVESHRPPHFPRQYNPQTPHYHHPHSHHHHQRNHDEYPRSPVELMVDITNRLGFRTLYQHSIGNRNNIALSPCGLASVLVALYEGSDGPSAIQIHKVMELPWDRDLVRIGFRDIHRRLRSYFYQEDNLLSGLRLSENNVTVRPEYENILRFYGYDLDNGNMITIRGREECKKNETAVEAPMTTTTEEAPTTTLIPMTTEEETEAVMTTTEAETEPPTTTPVSTSTRKPKEMTTSTTPMATEAPEVTTTEESLPETTTVAEARTTQYIYKFKPPKATTESEAEALELTTESETTTETVTTTEVPGQSSSSSIGDDDLNALKRRRRRKNRTFAGNSRWKRSPAPLHYLFAPLMDDEDVTVDHGEFFLSSGTPHPQYSISDYILPQPSFNLRDSLNETPQHEDVITHLFYLNRQDTINVPFKVFNSIMKYGYFSAIQSSVLEVDLDSKNYSLLLILPDWLDFGLDGLISTMKSAYAPNLRDIRCALQQSWVKAIIPKFFLTGHIVLTADLQNMGILDIFEPTRADFSPMTDLRGIYTRHVEQNVDVNIRTHANDHLNRRSAYHKNPVELSINHPFMFAIIDNEIDVAILTGRILNPLNARIQ